MSDIAWSYSRLKLFEDCPFKFYTMNISKQVKDTGSEAMDAGKRDHESLQKRVESATPLPAHLTQMEGVCRQFDQAKAHGYNVLTEKQWAFTRDFKPTGWFEKNVWVRVILDVGVVGKTKALVADYKTGKRNPDWDQLQLFAAATMLQYPEVQHVTAQFLWTKQGAEDKEEFTRTQLPEIWARFIPRVEKIQEANATRNWPKKPGRQCSWCPVKSQGFCKGE